MMMDRPTLAKNAHLALQAGQQYCHLFLIIFIHNGSIKYNRSYAFKISLHTHFKYIEKSIRSIDCLKAVKEEKFTVAGSSTHY